MAAIFRATAGTTLDATIATKYTVNTSFVGIIRSLLLSNTDSVARTVTGYFVPASGSIACANVVFPTISIPAITAVRFPLCTALEASATLQFLASTAGVVSIKPSVLEFPTPTIWKPQTPALLQVTAATYYTAASGVVGNVKEILLANTHSAAVTVTIYFDGTAAANTWFKTVSIPANTYLRVPLNEAIVAAGTIQALASIADKVSIRCSALEYS